MRVEIALRAVAFGAMVVLAWRLWSGGSPGGGHAAIDSTSLDSALASWTAAAPARATVNAATLPDRRQRDWLVALRRTGMRVAWVTRDTARVAIVAEAGPLAHVPTRLVALGEPASTIRIRDELGIIDSANTGDDGVATWRASPVGPVRAVTGRSVAVGQPRDSLTTRPVLVIGQAGWESKFVIAALEEEGWSVASRITVAPGAIVRQRAVSTIDTASFSAVVVLDSVSQLDASLTRFVRDGGGVVASGSGVNHPALRALLPRPEAAVPGEVGALLSARPLDGLQTRVFARSMNVIPLERRATQPIVVARRVGVGRIIGTGYDDTWRMRLSPPDENAPATHRAWWSDLVASVARTRLLARQTEIIDEAPFAATVDALGNPVTGDGDGPHTPMPWNAILATLATVALLAEWLARRLRGVP